MNEAATTRTAHLRPARRPPSEVMRLARMGCSHPTRLSFLRQLLRRLQQEQWHFDRPVWDIDANGVGQAVYRMSGPKRCYSLVAFAHDLPDEMRSDRVIATAWDATFTLFDGTPAPEDLHRLAQQVPLQEAGRLSASELSLSRANRSVRLFDHVVQALAAGRQPDRSQLEATGYLMRTTAVYGNGKFGAADRGRIRERPELRAPFQAEMLSVWLTRAFSVDLVEHLALAQGGTQATRLAPDLRRLLGVGNSTGLGMAPFLVRHPVLIHHWMQAREEALFLVRDQECATPETREVFLQTLAEAQENAHQWSSEHPVQQTRLQELRADLKKLEQFVEQEWSSQEPYPWETLWRWGERHLTEEGQEALLALLLEPHGALIDPLGSQMEADEEREFSLRGSMPVGRIQALLRENYAAALKLDYSARENSARFWYVSEEKLEPRLGERFEESGSEREQPLDIGRQARELDQELQRWPEDQPIASVLLAHPHLRSIARRVQLSARYPYAEIQDNLIGAELYPVDLLRCKLAFFGATRFDPRSDRWVRISLFQNAPYPEEFSRDVR